MTSMYTHLSACFFASASSSYPFLPKEKEVTPLPCVVLPLSLGGVIGERN